jgi:hypothetical protein
MHDAQPLEEATDVVASICLVPLVPPPTIERVQSDVQKDELLMPLRGLKILCSSNPGIGSLQPIMKVLFSAHEPLSIG